MSPGGRARPSPSPLFQGLNRTHNRRAKRERKIEGEGQKDEIDRDDATHRRGERKRTKSKDHLEIRGLVRALSNTRVGPAECDKVFKVKVFLFAKRCSLVVTVGAYDVPMSRNCCS